MGRSAKETDVNKSVEGIYTLPEFRNQGYAAAMVSEISKIIINQGKTAVLLTDINNAASNKSYKNVGFKDVGRLSEVEFYKD
ncbi:MAG: hypothetical protein DBX47_04545 [Clostridiales bacterium]|nr:MAG: hypothetical protein DBX47_04545 [Clostridiales bacterium]